MIYRIYFTVLLTEIILLFFGKIYGMKEDSIFVHIVSIIAFLIIVSAIVFAFWFIWTVGR